MIDEYGDVPELDIASIEAFLEEQSIPDEQTPALEGDLEARLTATRQNQLQLSTILRDGGMDLQLEDDQSITEKSLVVSDKIRRTADRISGLALEEKATDESKAMFAGLQAGSMTKLQKEAERLYLAAKVSHCMPIDNQPVSDYLIQDAIEEIFQNPDISSDERAILLGTLESIVDSETYGRITEELFESDVLVDSQTREQELAADIDAQAKRAEAVLQLIHDTVGAEHANHDDWQGFVRRILNFSYIAGQGAQQSILTGQEAALQETASRLDIPEHAQKQLFQKLRSI